MAMEPRRVLIMGAAGRDFHNFNVYFRHHPGYRVVAFTATQIPNIADRVYPPSLAGERYPQGIPIYTEQELERLIRQLRVDEVVFAYSDVSHEHVMHQASRALACGADFRLMGPATTMLRARRPVAAVTAVRTGAGKSQTTRRVVQVLRQLGLRVAVVRHPMPYGELEGQAVQRFARREDLDRHRCTVEEREEYEPHLEAGSVVYAGVDYEAILRRAEAEAQVLVWDGGNNDVPFYWPDLHIVVLDPHRAGHELTYHPGETNLRMAHVAIINKVDTAPPGSVEAVRESVRRVNPQAVVIEAASPVTVDRPELVRGRRAVVVEDGPTLTHGGMAYGAGRLAALRLGATLVDPRPHAVGSLGEIFRQYPHLVDVLPAMGYGQDQVAELAATLNACDADVVVMGTPVDLSRLVSLNKPAVRVRYELEQQAGSDLARLLCERLLPLVDASPPGSAQP